MINKCKGVALRVDNKDASKVGSGVMLKSKNNYYVITAFHCIKNKEGAALLETINIWDDIDGNKLTFKIDAIYYFKDQISELTDLAIIKLINTVIYKDKEYEINDLSQYKKNKLILQNGSRRLDCIDMVGYPEYTRDNNALSLERESFKLKRFRSDENKFKISDIEDDSGRINSRLEGYSGSGCFEEKGNLMILDGIFTEYDTGKKVGEGVSSKKIEELFDRYNLEKPILFGNYIEEKIRDKLEVIYNKELEDKASDEVLNNFKEFIESNIIDLKKFISNIDLESYRIDLDEYIEYTLTTLYLLEHYKIDKEIDVYRKVIKINKFFTKPFIKSEMESRKFFEGKYERFKKYEVINDKERIYIKGYKGEEFSCCDCKYESKNRILRKLISIKSKGLLGEKSSENIEKYCGDCIKLNEKNNLKSKVNKLWK